MNIRMVGWGTLSWFYVSDPTFLIYKDPVKVQDFADPGLDVLYLVAELRHVGKGECIFRVPVRDAANQLAETEAEVETDCSRRTVGLDMPSLPGVRMHADVVDAVCLDSVKAILFEILSDDILYETFLGIFAYSSVLRCSTIHFTTPVNMVRLHLSVRAIALLWIFPRRDAGESYQNQEVAARIKQLFRCKEIITLTWQPIVCTNSLKSGVMK